MGSVSCSSLPRSRQLDLGFGLQRESELTLVLTPASLPSLAAKAPLHPQAGQASFSRPSLQELTQDANAGERLMEKAGERVLCRRHPGRML